MQKELGKVWKCGGEKPTNDVSAALMEDWRAQKTNVLVGIQIVKNVQMGTETLLGTGLEHSCYIVKEHSIFRPGPETLCPVIFKGN